MTPLTVLTKFLIETVPIVLKYAQKTLYYNYRNNPKVQNSTDNTPIYSNKRRPFPNRWLMNRLEPSDRFRFILVLFLLKPKRTTNPKTLNPALFLPQLAALLGFLSAAYSISVSNSTKFTTYSYNQFQWRVLLRLNYKLSKQLSKQTVSHSRNHLLALLYCLTLKKLLILT